MKYEVDSKDKTLTFNTFNKSNTLLRCFTVSFCKCPYYAVSSVKVYLFVFCYCCKLLSVYYWQNATRTVLLAALSTERPTATPHVSRATYLTAELRNAKVRTPIICFTISDAVFVLLLRHLARKGHGGGNCHPKLPSFPNNLFDKFLDFICD